MAKAWVDLAYRGAVKGGLGVREAAQEVVGGSAQGRAAGGFGGLRAFRELAEVSEYSAELTSRRGGQRLGFFARLRTLSG